jgi:hypothetical protein
VLRTAAGRVSSVAFCCAISWSAAAQEPPAVGDMNEAESPETRASREAFLLGARLANEGRWADALVAFERSAALRPHPVTSFNIGYCERALGRYSRAYQSFRHTLQERRDGEAGRLPENLLVDAHRYLQEMDRRLARVRVTVSPAGTAISVDGMPVHTVSIEEDPPLAVAGTRPRGPPELPPAETFDLLLEPGSHSFLLATRGMPDTAVGQEFTAGQRTAITLRVSSAGSVSVTQALPRVPLERLSTVAPEQPAGTPPATRPVTHDRSAPQGGAWTQRSTGLVIAGVGAVGLGVGAFYGLRAFAKWDERDSGCEGGVCKDAASAAGEDAERAATISNVAFGIGAITLGLGALVYFTAEDPPEAMARTHVIVTGSSAAVVVGSQW